MLKLRVVRYAFAAALFFFPVMAPAHEGATGIVKERMDAMESMAKAMKAIDRRIKAKGNLAAIADDASRIHTIGARIPQQFPSGTHQHPSEALPAIWRQWPSFEAKAAQFETESAKLASLAASGDAHSITAQYRAVAQSCSGCHQDFRAKR